MNTESINLSEMTAEDKKSLEDYLKAMEQYRSEKKKILEGYDHE